MISQLKNIIFRFSKIAGLELLIEADGSVIYNLILLEKKKSLIISTLMKANIRSVDELLTFLPKDIPVALSISGKGVLFKKVAVNQDGKSLLEQVLPNALAEDLYISTIKVAQQYVFLARKDRIDPFIHGIEEKGLSVVNISVGVAELIPLLPFISSELREIQAGGFQLNLLNGNLQDIQSTTNTIAQADLKLGEELIPTQLIPSFATAFNMLGLGAEPLNDDVLTRFENWKEKSVFQKLSKVLLIFFASLIFINLGLFFYLSGENSDLGAKNSTVLADIKRIEDLEKELKLKEKFLREAGWIKSSQTSLYADQVAKTVPNTVLLKELSVHPTNQTASRKDKRMVFETGIILISGTCKDPVVLNPWLVELKKLNWVKTAVSKKYQYDHKKRIGYFELELSVDAKIISRI